MVPVALVGALIAASDAAIALCSGVCGSELTFLGAMLPGPPSATGAAAQSHAAEPSSIGPMRGGVRRRLARAAAPQRNLSKLPNRGSIAPHGGAEPLAR